MSNTFELIEKINKILNKDNISVGYTKSNEKQMIIEDNNKRYIVTIDEIENPQENMFYDINKYL